MKMWKSNFYNLNDVIELIFKNESAFHKLSTIFLLLFYLTV